MFGRSGDDGIVSIDTHTEARRLAPLRVTEAYWHALCNNGEIPARSAIDPRGMESALENAFLLERIAPTMAKIRVAGSLLSDLMGMDVTGMPLSTLIAVEDRDRFGEAIGQLFADPAIIRMKLRGQAGFGRPALDGEMIILPLKSDFGEVTRALGAFVTATKIGRAPRRFAVTEVDVEKAMPKRPVTPAPLAKPPASERPGTERAGPSDAAPVAGPVPRIPRAGTSHTPARTSEPALTRGHLRLVVSND
jgi:hypothetical protein